MQPLECDLRTQSKMKQEDALVILGIGHKERVTPDLLRFAPHSNLGFLNTLVSLSVLYKRWKPFKNVDLYRYERKNACNNCLKVYIHFFLCLVYVYSNLTS